MARGKTNVETWLVENGTENGEWYTEHGEWRMGRWLAETAHGMKGNGRVADIRRGE